MSEPLISDSIIENIAHHIVVHYVKHQNDAEWRIKRELLELRSTYEARIAELEERLERNGAWMPVQDEYIYTHQTGLQNRPQEVFVMWTEANELIVGEAEHSSHSCPLPPDIRLCRRTDSEEASDE